MDACVPMVKIVWLGHYNTDRLSPWHRVAAVSPWNVGGGEDSSARRESQTSRETPEVKDLLAARDMFTS